MNSPLTTLSKRISIFACLLCATTLFAQNSNSIIQSYFEEHQTELKLESADVSDWVITNEYYSNSTAITHVYIKQQLNGLEIVNGSANFNLLNGEVFSMGDRLVKGIAQKSNGASPSISPQQAIQSAAEQLDIELNEPLKIINPISVHEFVFDKAGISLENIPVKLVYQYTSKDEVRLAWDLSINTLDAQNWWSVRVDAETGTIIGKNNWTSQCLLEACGHDNHAASVTSSRTYRSTCPTIRTRSRYQHNQPSQFWGLDNRARTC